MKYKQTAVLWLRTVLFTVIHVPVSFLLLLAFMFLFYSCFPAWLLWLTVVIVAYLLSSLTQRSKRPILASVFLLVITCISLLFIVSLHQSRSTSAVAPVKIELREIMLRAALLNNEMGSYESVCSDEGITQALDAASEKAKKIRWRSCDGVVLKFFRTIFQESVPSFDCTASAQAYEIKLYIPAYELYWTIDSDGEAIFPYPGDEGMVIVSP